MSFHSAPNSKCLKSYLQYFWLFIIDIGVDHVDDGGAGAHGGDDDQEAQGLPRGHQVGPVILNRCKYYILDHLFLYYILVHLFLLLWTQKTDQWTGMVWNMDTQYNQNQIPNKFYKIWRIETPSPGAYSKYSLQGRHHHIPPLTIWQEQGNKLQAQTKYVQRREKNSSKE